MSEIDSRKLLEPRDKLKIPERPIPSIVIGKMDFRNDEYSSPEAFSTIVPHEGGSPPQNRNADPSFPEKSNAARELVSQTIRAEYIYAMLGLVLGFACIIGGVILGLNGVAGSTSWTASLLGLESKINDAAPGVVLFIVGIFLVWITKPKVKIGEVKG